MHKNAKYKIVLVEDEKTVRDAICGIIAWDSLGFELAGEAGNGQEALDIIEAAEPDVIITDICMPFLDGLELARRAALISPTSRVVIITGFDEFDYAQKAVKLNVYDFILKPVTASEFSETLLKIKQELDREFVERTNLERLKEQYAESLGVLRNRFFLNLFMGNLDRMDIQTSIERLSLDIISDRYIAAILRLDNISEVAHSFGEDNKPLASFAVLNIMQDILEKYDQAVIVNDKDYQYSVLFIQKRWDDKDFKTHVLRIVDEIIISLKKYMNMVISAGIGDECDALDKVRYSYNDAATALEYRVLIGCGKAIVKSDVERRSSFVYQNIQDKLTRFANTLKIGTKQEILEDLDLFFSVIQHENTGLSVFRTSLMELSVTIIKAYSHLNALGDENIQTDFQLLYKVLEMEDLSEIQQYFRDACMKLYDQIMRERQDEWTILAEKAMLFIKDNYQNKNLNVQMVCDHLHLSASYFSRVFKNGTGDKFVDCLTALRIDRAKELLRNTALKSYEIADMVGYQDPHYFSHIFKKKTGATPREYRSK